MIRSHRGRRGSLLMFFVACMLLLLMCCVLAIDVGRAQTQQAQNRGIIEAVCTQKASPSTTAYIKNLDNPGDYIVKTIMQGMRDNGLKGKVQISYYELSQAAVEGGWARSLGAGAWKYFSFRNRIYVYDVVYEEPFHFGFIPDALDPNIMLKSTYIKGANPYAEIKIWRPDEVGGIAYESRDGDYLYVARTYTLAANQNNVNLLSKTTVQSRNLPGEVLYEAQRIFDSIDPEHPGLAVD